MSALNIEHLELILHLRFAVKVIAGFDIISQTLFRLNRNFYPRRSTRGGFTFRSFSTKVTVPPPLAWLIFTVTTSGSIKAKEEQAESVAPACCGSFLPPPGAPPWSMFPMRISPQRWPLMGTRLRGGGSRRFESDSPRSDELLNHLSTRETANESGDSHFPCRPALIQPGHIALLVFRLFFCWKKTAPRQVLRATVAVL